MDLTIEVGNTGDTALAAVTVDDDLVDACDRVLGALAVGEDATYTCTGTVGEDDLADVTTVTATPPAGPEVTASDGAVVDVVHPSLTVDVTASDDEVERRHRGHLRRDRRQRRRRRARGRPRHRPGGARLLTSVCPWPAARRA